MHHRLLKLPMTRISTTALIATGGTAVAALGMLLEWGLKQSQIKIISVLGSTEGVKHVTTEYPEVEVSDHGRLCSAVLLLSHCTSFGV